MLSISKAAILFLLFTCFNPLVLFFSIYSFKTGYDCDFNFVFYHLRAILGTMPKLALWRCAKFEIQSSSYLWDYLSVLHGCICWVKKRELATSCYAAWCTAFLFHEHYCRVLILLTGLVEVVIQYEVEGGLTTKSNGPKIKLIDRKSVV